MSSFQQHEKPISLGSLYSMLARTGVDGHGSVTMRRSSVTRIVKLKVGALYLETNSTLLRVLAPRLFAMQSAAPACWHANGMYHVFFNGHSKTM